MWKIHIVCVSTQHKQITANSNKTTQWNLQDRKQCTKSVAVRTRECSGRVMCRNKTVASLAKAFHHKCWPNSFHIQLGIFRIIEMTLTQISQRTIMNWNLCWWLLSFTENFERKGRNYFRACFHRSSFPYAAPCNVHQILVSMVRNANIYKKKKQRPSMGFVHTTNNVRSHKPARSFFPHLFFLLHQRKMCVCFFSFKRKNLQVYIP